MTTQTEANPLVQKRYQKRIHDLESTRRSVLRKVNQISRKARSHNRAMDSPLFRVESTRKTWELNESLKLDARDAMLWVNWVTEIREIESNIVDICDEIISRVCPGGNKETKIRALKEYLQQDLHAKYVAEAVGCCEVYARNFSWDADERDVYEKAYAKNRREQQVDAVKRNQVMKRDSNTCVWCGKFNGRKQVHHVVPVSQGGTDAMENLALLCRECHSEVHRGNGHGGVIYDSPEDFWKRTIYSQHPDRTGE